MSSTTNNESPIELATEKLYEPGAQLQPEHRAHLHREAYEVADEWEHKNQNDKSIGGLISKIPMRISKHHGAIKWLFVGALAFFVIAAGVAFYFVAGGRNTLSSDKIEITVTGPVSVAAGEVVPLAIEIVNNNSVTLEVADLVVEYPQGTRAEGDPEAELSQFRAGLGDLAPGERIATTTKAVLFGREGDEAQIVVRVEYRLAGSNAIFEKERALTVQITSTPVSLVVSAPTSLNSGQGIEFKIEVVSNSSLPLKNVSLKADYPFGFAFASSEPDPSFSESVWNLGDIAAGSTKTVRVRGTLEGQDGEERVFRFEAGTPESDDASQIATEFARAERTVEIARPFVGLAVALNGDTGETLTIAAGVEVRGSVRWKNNLATPIADAEIRVEIEGEGIDERSVSVTNGTYDSLHNAITWNKRGFDDLELIPAGGEGRAEFSFRTLGQEALGGASPNLTLATRLSAVPVSESATPEKLVAEISQKVQFASDLSLAAKALHFTGPLENSGPIPPKEDTETTYTIVWTVRNSFNEVRNVAIAAELPPFVAWRGVVSPGGEDVSFDEDTGEVVWSAGTVAAGAGTGGKPAREVAFQIGLTPSANQVGTVPILISDATLSGTDTATGAVLRDTFDQLTTNLSSDPQFDIGDDKVVGK